MHPVTPAGPKCMEHCPDHPLFTVANNKANNNFISTLWKTINNSVHHIHSFDSFVRSFMSHLFTHPHTQPTLLTWHLSGWLYIPVSLQSLSYTRIDHFLLTVKPACIRWPWDCTNKIAIIKRQNNKSHQLRHYKGVTNDIQKRRNWLIIILG